MKSSPLLILEIVWIATGLLSSAAAVRFAINEGGSKTLIFVLMALVSFAFAYVRHNQRKKS